MDYYYHREIPYRALTIEKRHLEKVIGYHQGDTPELFTGMIEQALSQGEHYCRIQGGYVILDEPSFDKTEKTLQLNGVVLNIHRIIFHQLQHAELIAGFVCTAGPEIVNWSRSLMSEGDLMMGYVVDVLGSLIVESATDILQEDLRTHMQSEGFRITNRYSPGYCGWSTAEQQKLFTFFPKGFCGITLTESSLMHPIKSVSGIIGIGSRVKFNAYTCNLCDMKNCIYRNLKAS